MYMQLLKLVNVNFIYLFAFCQTWIWSRVPESVLQLHWVTLTPPLPPYLQVWHPFLEGLRVVSQGLLLLQELGIPSFSSWLEEAIVVNVPQGLGEGADDLLFGVPHRAVQVKLETPLLDREHRSNYSVTGLQRLRLDVGWPHIQLYNNWITSFQRVYWVVTVVTLESNWITK